MPRTSKPLALRNDAALFPFRVRDSSYNCVDLPGRHGSVSLKSSYEGPVAMPKVTIANEKKAIEVPDGANLRVELRKAGPPVYKGLPRFPNCFGHGTCGTCRILVKKGMEHLSPKGGLEKFTLWRMISAIGFEDEMRLSCRCAV